MVNRLGPVVGRSNPVWVRNDADNPIPISVPAADGIDVKNNVDNLKAAVGVGNQVLTVTNAVVQFGNFPGASHIFWTSEDAQCRVTFDGTNPTASVGHLIEAGSNGTWTVELMSTARFIRTAGTNATIYASPLVAV